MKKELFLMLLFVGTAIYGMSPDLPQQQNAPCKKIILNGVPLDESLSNVRVPYNNFKHKQDLKNLFKSIDPL